VGSRVRIHEIERVVDCKAAVLNLFRPDDHLKILSLGCGPPLKIVSWEIAKIDLLISLQNKK